MLKRIKRSQPLTANGIFRVVNLHYRDPMPPVLGNEFDADRITTKNWNDGIICQSIRGSKKYVWASKMWLPEGFTITLHGQKIRGNRTNWLIIDGTQKYILTERMFRKKYRKVNDE